jgi:hypothetical protein
VCALCEPCDEPAPAPLDCAGVQVHAVFALVMMFLAIALF